jgi:hypothetical protein
MEEKGINKNLKLPTGDYEKEKGGDMYLTSDEDMESLTFSAGGQPVVNFFSR